MDQKKAENLAALLEGASVVQTRQEKLAHMRAEKKEDTDYHHVQIAGLLICDEFFKQIEKWGGIQTPALGRALFHHVMNCRFCTMLQG